MNKFMAIIGVLVCLGVAFYYDASTDSLTKEFRSSILYTPDEIEAVTVPDENEVETEIDQTETIIPTFEYILESTEEVDGYLVETYREFEFYKDVNGNLIKKVPTSHFDFIRYKK
ncbi:hypothetical protein [Pseudoneobacillus rhizosphaerae]|uniref:Uncharacterized protein n=1 Tax=Pseudoneobacillus rhizosphaerae TaxID=2880968 RepID=A0A9C7GDX5_9BACI|nr:hypothetical protein [Pseudoneobacillus rhizosphaerae]CAG9610616.1 hypothetical protein NEOCIP111885_04391 [Pseudoneobacillus rhizosphaerae]